MERTVAKRLIWVLGFVRMILVELHSYVLYYLFNI